MLMHHLLYDGAERHPDKIALRWVDRDSTATFAQAVAAMERCGGALHHLGVRRGDRVTIFAHNGMDYVISLFACWRIGAIAALVNVRFAEELDYYFADHTPSVVIYTHDMHEPVRRAAAGTESIRALVCMDGPQPGAESLPALLAAGFPPPPDPADEAAVAHLSYTSGTTGRPKGACLAHEPTMRAANCIAERLRMTGDDVSFGPTALSSSYQLVGNLLPPLHRGATVNVMGRWTQASGFDALERTQASILVGNPTLLTELLIEARARSRIPTRLRITVSGGAPVPPSLKRALRDEWRLPLAESYGQSELGGFMALGDPVLAPDDKLGAVGRPLPDKEVRILDAGGKRCRIGEVGEVCLRGGYMTGYWGQPEKTAETLRGGWLHSGDAGSMDRDGYVTMRGRFAELITVAGRTWFPRDVEEALCAQAGVKEAALVGLPDAALGQRPVAFVTLTVNDIDLDRLKAALGPLLSYDLAPLSIRSLDAFPMTPTGKIAKAELRQNALAAP
ncbi:MAG: long-chain fatty acid--CoA ligase [Proteobacteria bacterium]|nr:MAG: long-chain fatty acid--CoA ligase [Pseudomonadota bacterium]